MGPKEKIIGSCEFCCHLNWIVTLTSEKISLATHEWLPYSDTGYTGYHIGILGAITRWPAESISLGMQPHSRPRRILFFFRRHRLHVKPPPILIRLLMPLYRRSTCGPRLDETDNYSSAHASSSVVQASIFYFTKTNKQQPRFSSPNSCCPCWLYKSNQHQTRYKSSYHKVKLYTFVLSFLCFACIQYVRLLLWLSICYCAHPRPALHLLHAAPARLLLERWIDVSSWTGSLLSKTYVSGYLLLGSND